MGDTPSPRGDKMSKYWNEGQVKLSEELAVLLVRYERFENLKADEVGNVLRAWVEVYFNADRRRREIG